MVPATSGGLPETKTELPSSNWEVGGLGWGGGLILMPHIVS